MAKSKTINVQGKEITLIANNANDYISLTDMARYRDADRTNYIIQNWMRTRSAIEFCGLWNCITLILKASNSMPLKANPAQIVLH